MVAALSPASVTLNGGPFQPLEMPQDVVSLEQALDHAKAVLGAEWVHGCPRGGSSLTHLRRLSDLTDIHKSGKKQLVLSAAGWQPGGGGPGEGASLLCLRVLASHEGKSEVPADELPASLLRRGCWYVQAYTAEHMQVTLDLGGGRCVSLPVTAATRYADVKAYAAALLGKTAEEAQLWKPAPGPDSDDDQVVPRSHMYVRVRGQHALGESEVVVKTLTGKHLFIHCAPSSIVADVVMQIEEQEGIPPDMQRLVFAGRQLEHARTLASYGIHDGSTLHLVMRLRGGMFQCTSGRDGGFAVLDLAVADEDAGIVQEIADAGLVPVEVLLPDGTTVLLECQPKASNDHVMAVLRKRLAQRALLQADVDEVQDVEALRDMLRQAQAALRQR